MKTYDIDYDGSTGPEDAESGRVWDVIQIEDNVRTLFAQRCTLADAKRIVECVNAMDGIDDPAGFIRMQRDHVGAQHESLGKCAERIAELVACVEDVLDADGNLYMMDFDRYRRAVK